MTNDSTPQMNVAQSANDQPMPVSQDRTNKSFLGRNWQKILAVAIWVTLISGVVWYSVSTGKTPTETLRDIVTLLQTPFGPLIYILIYTIRPIAFFSAVVMTLLGGAIFGSTLGIVYTVIGANLSATVAYVFGRFLGEGLLQSDDKADTGGIIQRYADRMRRNVFQTVLVMRLIYLPYDLVNYLGGFLRVDYKAFILGTILGSLPGTVTFVLAGASINIEDALMGNSDASPFNGWALIASALLFIASLVLSRYFQRREAQQADQ